AIGVPHTKIYKALIYFGNALDALDAGKWQEANDYFGMALKEDPMFDLAKIAADTCPSADYPNINSISNMPAARISSILEAYVNAAESISTHTDTTDPESLLNSGYIGTDVLGIDIGGIGINQVGNETVVPVLPDGGGGGGPSYPSGPTYP
ncbi:MAG: hypothetical protein KKD92_07415, partial [Proteobacteria bacterium]|nr:hypothetical protein [Pseudomonadota bacterium]